MRIPGGVKDITMSPRKNYERGTRPDVRRGEELTGKRLQITRGVRKHVFWDRSKTGKPNWGAA